jgi:glucose/arabinose dehydrogenase
MKSLPIHAPSDGGISIAHERHEMPATQQSKTLRHRLGRFCLSAARLSAFWLALALAGALPAAAATNLPSGFEDVTVATGLSAPTAMQFAPDGRLFVAEQSGRLRVIKNGALLATPFITLTVDSAGERGLLGIAFDPNFVSNQFLYLFYTATTPAIHNRVSRFKANGDLADSAHGEVVLLDFDNLSSATNHNGGAIHFGEDGKLYVAHGDNATGANAQTLGNLLGKVIRMNPLPDPVGQIPTDNPFYNTATGKNRLIWTLGLRNPFTFSVQPGSGRIFINDVGQITREEINEGQPGRNFGWPTTEGPFSSASYPQFTNPFYSYAHTGTTPYGCAITGGAFYDPDTPTFPAFYLGKYFFADYCGHWIYYIDPATPTAASQFAGSLTNPVDLKVGPDGALYYLSRGASRVGKIRPAAAGAAPQIAQHPANLTVPVGAAATFSVAATGTAPLAYQWQKNGANISGATTSVYQTPPATAPDNNSTYRAVVTNSYGSVTSNAATLTVTSNTPPVATIVAPAVGAKYNAGTTLSFSGTATDQQSGTLPASAFRWRIDFHHDTHTHPAMADTVGITSGTFAVPNSGETSANVWYRVYLTVTDSGGLSTTTFVDVQPNKVNLTLNTVPAGLQVTLDGQPMPTPATVSSVVGIIRTIGAVTPQASGTNSYQFASWSDGDAATHNIQTPSTNRTYTASYQLVPLAAPTNLTIQVIP